MLFLTFFINILRKIRLLLFCTIPMNIENKIVARSNNNAKRLFWKINFYFHTRPCRMKAVKLCGIQLWNYSKNRNLTENGY